MKSARVYFQDKFAGRLTKSDEGYSFSYDSSYLNSSNAVPISMNFSLKVEPYHHSDLFPFFKNLIPEGWLFELNARALNIDPKDFFGMLLATGRDCIGAVSVIPDEEEK